MPTTLKKIWGIEYEEIHSDQYLIWKLYIRNPFNDGRGWKVGINEKLIRRAWAEGVHKFLLQVGQKEINMPVPSRYTLKAKERMNDFEMKPSLFLGSPAMKIYWFML